MHDGVVFRTRYRTLPEHLAIVAAYLERCVAAHQAALEAHRAEAHGAGGGAHHAGDTCTGLEVSLEFYQEKLVEVDQQRRSRPGTGLGALRN